MSTFAMRQSATVKASTGAHNSIRSRCTCVCVQANASAQGTGAASSSIDRRMLLLGASAAAIGASQVFQVAPAAAEEPFRSVIDDTPEPSADVPDAGPAAPAAQQEAASGALSQVTTAEGNVRLQTYTEATQSMTPTDKQIFTLNRRVQAQNRAPDDFPGFIREGFDITVVGEGYQLDSNGLIYKDFAEGAGSSPVDGQQVVFDYTGYNESGTVIDSSYRKGRAAEVRLGINGLIPGFELGIKGMKPGGKRRIVVPPALGPPVGPSTFFSAKQCEVFDVELRQVKTCTRRQMAMFSDVVCE